MAGKILPSTRRIDLNYGKKICYELAKIREINMKLIKAVDTIAIVLLLALTGVGFIIMQKTVESNAVTAEIALIQAKNKKRVIQEVGLLTAEMRNLQKDIENLRNKLEKKE